MSTRHEKGHSGSGFNELPDGLCTKYNQDNGVQHAGRIPSKSCNPVREWAKGDSQEAQWFFLFAMSVEKRSQYPFKIVDGVGYITTEDCLHASAGLTAEAISCDIDQFQNSSLSKLAKAKINTTASIGVFQANVNTVRQAAKLKNHLRQLNNSGTAIAGFQETSRRVQGISAQHGYILVQRRRISMVKAAVYLQFRWTSISSRMGALQATVVK